MGRGAHIDHFKSVDDRWSHPAGAAVIKAVVGEIARALGSTHRLGRLGGEEFGALLHGVCPEAAIGLVQRLREGVAGLRLPRWAGPPSR